MRPSDVQKVLALAHAPNITKIFGPSLSADADIYLASDANYSVQVSQRWSIHAAPSYIAKISSILQVKIAPKHDIPFLVTGGGHGISSHLASLQDGLQIDLANFNSVEFDPSTAQLTVGGAAKFSQINDILYDSGYQFPIGTAPCVGILGATLGGGVSANQGRFGLLVDLLESVKIVTPSGDAVNASRTENSDLFWGLRGAGANFGIVTSAVFKVLKAVNNGNVVNANYFFPAHQVGSVFKVLRSLDSEFPENLALNIFTSYDPKSDQIFMLLNVNYYGPTAEASPYLEKFDALEPLRSEILTVPWTHVFETSYFGVDDTKACGRRQHINMYGIAARKTDASALETFANDLLDFSRTNNNITTSLVVHRFATQAVLRVPDEDSAYPYRNVQMHIQLEAELHDGRQDHDVDVFLQSARAKLNEGNGFDSKSVYVNFAHGDEGAETWYGVRKLEKLGRLKSKWDPNDLFSFYNPVPPRSS
ncbi:FAD binding domain-containing protein [Seiridium cupressi]